LIYGNMSELLYGRDNSMFNAISQINEINQQKWVDWIGWQELLD